MSPGKRVVVLVLLVVSCLIAYTSRPITASATAGINSQISFTGKLVKTDNTNITDGTYNMEFKVYQDGTSAGVGSTLMWTEDYLVAGSTGMPSTGGVTFSSGTFSVNLGSICAFAGGTCGAKTNTGIDFNQNTLWVSVQIGNSTSCTVVAGVTSFNTACGGDGEMSPYIRLTAVPYAANAALLSGIAVTALGQLASNQTWTGTNTFQPTTNISSALIKQTSVASPTADIFNVQTANATTLLQFTGPSANASNIVLQSAGASSTVSIGTNAIANTIQIGQSGANAVTQTIAIGNGGAGSTTNVTIGNTVAGTTTLQNSATINLNAATIVGNVAAQTLFNTVATSANIFGAATGTIAYGGAAGNTTFGNTGAYTLQGVSGQAFTVKGQGASTFTLDTGSTGTINLGATAQANTIQIGTGTTLAATQTINIGNSTGGSAITNILIGSATGASAGTTTLQAKGIVTLQSFSAGLTIDTITAAQTTAIANSGVTHTLQVATSSSAAQSITIGGAATGSATSNASTTIALQGGATVFNVANGGASVVAYTDSATAFQVQDSTTAPIFLVDTIGADNNGNTNLITNPGFETGTTGWAGSGTGASCTTTNVKANVYFGLASLDCTLASSGTTTATVSNFTSTLTAGNYNFSFYAKATGAVTLSATVTFTGGVTNCSNLAPTAVTATGFQRFTCNVTTSGTTTDIRFTTTTTALHVYIDAVQLTSGTSGGAVAMPYRNGNLQLRGVVNNPAQFQAVSNSTNAFQIQTAANTAILTVDSYNGVLVVGSGVTDTNQVLLQLDSFSTFADTATCSTTNNQGAMYYNTNSNEIRACINAAWQDVASTEDLALQLFGVVPNSGNTPGDILGVNGNANSPCKVYWASATTYSVAPCNAYSGGRKVAVAAVAGATFTLAASNYANICLNSSGVPTLSAASATDGLTNTVNLTATNATTLGQPLLCLATIKASSTANNFGGATNGIIYDTRTFTTTIKTYATLNSTTQILGGLYHPSTTFGLIAADAAVSDTNIMGVLVAGTGAASTTTTNVILATNGPQWIKATGTAAFPAAANTNLPLSPSTVAGYATTAATLATYGSSVGAPLAPAIATSCTTNTTAALTNCQTSQFTYLYIR